MKTDLQDIEYVDFDDAPESWSDRCSGDGYKRTKDENGQRIYADVRVPVDIGYRPCAKCGKYPSLDGDDSCIANLGNVMNACCGHGRNKGYIQFDNGITIRGIFEIERGNPYESPYAIRTREEIFNKIKELELENKDGHNSEMVYILKWVMQMK